MKANRILSKRFMFVRLLQLCTAPILVALLVLCLPSASRAQDTGYIAGTVTDKTGAAVAGARVVLVSVGGNLTRDTETNADGAYTVAGLPGGSYNLTVTADGFQRFVAQRIVLDVA